MKVTLDYITPNSLETIGRYAGICYNSSQEKSACVKRAISCKDKGHLATLRFAHATFIISGISRICSHQMVRSKHLDFLQRSQRYCDESETSFVFPGTTMDTRISSAYQSAMARYQELRADGVSKEDARFVLPEGTQTELIVTGNLQAWLDFVKLRADTHAQREIRTVAVLINNELAKHCEGVFNWMPVPTK